MTRGTGAIEAIQRLLPEWTVLLLGVLTQLGDAWFLGLLLAALYWRVEDRRPQIATVGGAALLGVATYRTLKYLFRFPRPERPLVDPGQTSRLVRLLYDATATASGYGFPSGHATGTTIVYVGLAGALAVGTRRLRYAVAAVVVTVVSVTRVALGLHFLVDVVVGVALGLTVLGASRAIVARSPSDGRTRLFALAVFACVAYVVVSGAAAYSVPLLVLALAVLFLWVLFERDRPLPAAPWE